MRTTLDIDDDILLAVKELAGREKTSAGKVLSRVARAGLLGVGDGVGTSGSGKGMRNGVPVFASGGDEVISADHVRELMDEEGV
ncbi:MAG: hypothetical protein AAGA58_14590 [Verrucomicrobiota bacterium]